MHSISKRQDSLALLAAFCIFLSIIEYLIPKPLPFMRIGLANLPILLSLRLYKPKEIIILIFLKILGQGLVNGTLFSYIFLFSAAGSLSSGLLMLGVAKLFKEKISLVGICLLGALASNSIQLFVASKLVFGKAALLIAPPFLIIGTISALILGIFSNHFLEKSLWVKGQREESLKDEN